MRPSNSSSSRHRAIGCNEGKRKRVCFGYSVAISTTLVEDWIYFRSFGYGERALGSLWARAIKYLLGDPRCMSGPFRRVAFMTDGASCCHHCFAIKNSWMIPKPMD